ncbi:hypothetical protein [Weeksella sp. HMSC059D05]|uniref:hypothetical protein n=1 Tax=Weeksella sp. HMSC059D05 TaxID=1715139 RepID=UPI0008A18A2C|nr:hypothetical protein [Weeksella sp. HMSC059D05]OFM82631.1 hypothetical protein HMPREF2660_02965 [Weeksella sp. HMSC059D05]
MKSNRIHISYSFSVVSSFFLLLAFLALFFSSSILYSQVYNIGDIQLQIDKETSVSTSYSDSVADSLHLTSASSNNSTKSKIYILDGTVSKGLTEHYEVEIVEKPRPSEKRNDSKWLMDAQKTTKFSRKVRSRKHKEENFVEKKIGHPIITDSPRENHIFLGSSKFDSFSINKKKKLDFFIAIYTNKKTSRRYNQNLLKETFSHELLSNSSCTSLVTTRPSPFSIFLY